MVRVWWGGPPWEGLVKRLGVGAGVVCKEGWDLRGRGFGLVSLRPQGAMLPQEVAISCNVWLQAGGVASGGVAALSIFCRCNI